MSMKLTPSRFADRFRGGAIFPGLFWPNLNAPLPFVGRKRFGGGFGLAFQPPKIYGRIGSLEVRLARKKGEIRRAQRLRYKVFYEEMSAVPTALAMLSRRDEDPYDAIFDHLLVVDHGNPAKGRWRRPRVVGTYRMLRQELADLNDGFYTQGEYDIGPLIRAKSPDYSFMELGRSCVLKPYRNRRTLELLWQGVWTYVREHGIDVMLGCASFEGTDPAAHAQALSFLHHTALAPEEWRVRAHEHRRVARWCGCGSGSASSAPSSNDFVACVRRRARSLSALFVAIRTSQVERRDCSRKSFRCSRTARKVSCTTSSASSGRWRIRTARV